MADQKASSRPAPASACPSARPNQASRAQTAPPDVPLRAPPPRAAGAGAVRPLHGPLVAPRRLPARRSRPVVGGPVGGAHGAHAGHDPPGDGGGLPRPASPLPAGARQGTGPPP